MKIKYTKFDQNHSINEDFYLWKRRLTDDTTLRSLFIFSTLAVPHVPNFIQIGDKMKILEDFEVLSGMLSIYPAVFRRKLTIGPIYNVNS